MKRKLFIITLLSFALAIVGCGGSNVEESNPVEANSSDTQIQEATIPADTEDTPLMDQALLDQFDGEMPEQYIMVQKSSVESMGDGNDMSMTSTVKMTVMGEYAIMEMSNDMMPGTMITIYNPDSKKTYQYTKGETFGMVFEDMESSMTQLYNSESIEMDIADYDEIQDIYGNNFTAKEEMYKGQKAIYIESKEVMADGTTVKMWFSQEFFIPLKYEIYSNGELLMASEVIEFEANPNLSQADFEPPSDVEFQNMTMNMDFEMPEMPATE